MAINAGSIVAYLELDTSKFTTGFRSAANDLKVFGDKTATTEQKAKGLQSAFATTGSMLTKSLTVPLLGVGVASVKMASDFESKMSNVKAISGATGSEFEQLKNKAMEMGAKTKFSASESADAFSYMAMAGWETADMLDGIEGIMNLAAASGEDLATTSDIVTDALTAFGLEAKDSAHFADVLAKASSSSNTNVGLMGETFKYVAPVAGALGYSVEDTAVAIGLMANAGIKGSNAGTALRSMMTRLAKPTDEVSKAMSDLNISLTDSQGNMKPFSQLMGEMRESFSGLTAEQKAQYAASIAGQQGMSGLLAIVNASDEDFAKLTQEINNANGAAQEMADVQLDNLQGSLTILGSALEGAGIVIGQRLSPYIRQLADWINELVTRFNELSPEQQDQIIKWGLMVAAIGPAMLVASKLIGVFTGVGKAVSFVTTTIPQGLMAFMQLKNGMSEAELQMEGFSKTSTGIGSALAGISPGAVIAVGGIALLAGAFVTLMATNEEFRGTMRTTFEQLKKSASEFADEFLERINQLGFDFSSVTELLTSLWTGFCNIVAPLFTGAFSGIVDIVSGVFDTIIGLLDIFIGVFTGNTEQAVTGVKEVIHSIVDTFGDLLSDIIGILGDITVAILEAFGFEDAAQKVSQFVGKAEVIFRRLPETIMVIAGKIGSFFTETIPQAIDTAVQAVSDFVSNIADTVSSFFTETIPNAVESAIEGVQSFVDTVAETVTSVFTETIPQVLESFGNTVATFFTSTIPQAFSSLADAAGQAVEAAAQWFSQLPEKIAYALGYATGTIISWGAQLISWVATTIPQVINNIVTFFSQLPGKIATWLTNTINKIQIWGSQMVNKAREIGTKFVQNVVTFFQQLPGKISTFLTNAISKVTSWASQMASKAKDAGTKFLNNVVNTIKNLPSKISSTLKNAITSVTQWASQMASKAKDAGTKFINGVINTVKNLPSKFKSAIDKVITTVTSWGSKLVSTGKSAAQKMANAVISGVSGLPGKMASVGRNIVQGVINGVNGMIGALKAKMMSIAKAALDGAKAALGIHSPSKVFNEEIGQNVVKGMIQGIDKQKGNAKKSAEELSKLYVDAADKKLSEIKKKNKVSLQSELEFWKQVLAETKKGTAGYKQAAKEISKIKNEIAEQSNKFTATITKDTNAQKKIENESLQNQIAYWKQIKANNKKGTDDYKEAVEKITDLKKQLNENIQKLDDEYEENIRNTKTQLLNSIAEVRKAYQDAITSRAEQIASSLSLFDAFASETELTKEALLENLQSQVDGIRAWDKALNDLKARGLSQGLLEELQNMGVDSLAELQLLVSMTDEELTKYVELWEEKQQLATDRAIEEIDKEEYLSKIQELINEAGTAFQKYEDEYTNGLAALGVSMKQGSVTVGNEIVHGIELGFTSQFPTMRAMITAQVQSIVDSVRAQLQIASPSKVFAGIGGFMAQGIGVGFKEDAKDAKKDIEKSVDDMTDVQGNVEVELATKSLVDSYKDKFTQFAMSIGDMFVNMVDVLSDSMTTVFDRLDEISYTMSGKMFDEYGEARKEKEIKTSQIKDEQTGNGTPKQSGDTFVFYNTKPDPYEYRRQMKKAKKELLAGT